ncbi:hypothetical protein DdX_14835 [Ditylenchus destructor]|uniref:Uncharacterized protein n=1 Tax=Ditylenchus destructor TaxID=166010 RepID=A0AAD4MRA5_9BILA|nr:hypothetical protein DdX_14835 [Ditylenchus destructor]
MVSYTVKICVLCVLLGFVYADIEVEVFSDSDSKPLHKSGTKSNTLSFPEGISGRELALEIEKKFENWNLHITAVFDGHEEKVKRKALWRKRGSDGEKEIHSVFGKKVYVQYQELGREEINLENE